MSNTSAVSIDNGDLFLFGDLRTVEEPWASMLDIIDSLPEGLPQAQVDAVLQGLNVQAKSALTTMPKTRKMHFPKAATLLAGEMRRLGGWSDSHIRVTTTGPNWG